MKMVKFVRDFDWWGPHPNCIVCKWALFAFKRSDVAIPISPEAAKAAIDAGAAVEAKP